MVRHRNGRSRSTGNTGKLKRHQQLHFVFTTPTTTQKINALVNNKKDKGLKDNNKILLIYSYSSVVLLTKF